MRRKVDTATVVGSLSLRAPVLTASGTAGHGAELGAYVDLAELGAVVVKSLSADPWPGNAPPRVHPTAAGMLNSVGLQGPGVGAWRQEHLPELVASGATVVASIWGRNVQGFADAAALLHGAPGVVAVEVNVSCPNVEDRSRMFAHSPRATAEAVDAASAAGLPRWVKLSPNVPDIVEIAGAALDAGAEALVLVNTVLGMAVDPVARAYRLGSGAAGGGLSGPAIRPVAVRAVHDCRAAFPQAGIVGVGGVARGQHAAELLVAGADAVAVGTATFADPRAPAAVLHQLVRWCRRHRVAAVRDLVAAVHAGAADASALADLRAPGPTPSAAGPRPAEVRGPEPAPSEVAHAPSGASSGPADGASHGLPPGVADHLRDVLQAVDRQVAMQDEQVAELRQAVAHLARAMGEQPGPSREPGPQGLEGAPGMPGRSPGAAEAAPGTVPGDDQAG